MLTLAPNVSRTTTHHDESLPTGSAALCLTQQNKKQPRPTPWCTPKGASYSPRRKFQCSNSPRRRRKPRCELPCWQRQAMKGEMQVLPELTAQPPTPDQFACSLAAYNADQDKDRVDQQVNWFCKQLGFVCPPAARAHQKNRSLLTIAKCSCRAWNANMLKTELNYYKVGHSS